MTNRNMNMNRRTAERATERARIITARKKASAKKKRIIVSVVALVLVLVAGASAVIVGVANNHAKPAAAKPLVTTTTAAPKAENRPVSQLSEKAAEHEEHIPEEENNNEAPETNETPEYNEQPKDENNNNEAAAENATQPQEQDKIEVVNGDRIYIDTKRQAPAVTGTPLHFYANGKTSYGFDWDYNTDNANFVLRCDYNFNAQQYDFQFYGVTPGTANVTLYYFTADGVKIPVNMTINVDNDLNVTQA